MYLNLECESTHQDSKRDEDAYDDSCQRRNLVLVLPRIHVHIRLEPIETIHVVVQPLVFSKLTHEARVGVDEPPSLPNIHKRLLECQFIFVHYICNDDRGGPGYSEMAVDEHISFLQSLIDEGVGHWEVGQDMGLRSVVGPNEECANIGISKSRFRQPMCFDREHMGDVKPLKDFGVGCCSGIAEVEARDYLAIARLIA